MKNEVKSVNFAWCRSCCLRWGLPIVVSLLWLAVAQTPSAMQRLVSAGRLDSMRWPDFRDYRPAVEEFYERGGYAPAWVQQNKPSAAALSILELFKNAWKKGLDPEDYDASRWEARLRELRSSADAVATFDVAFTVCTMRYVSALRIGRIDPQHFKFGLDTQNKKYDLPEFLRDRLVPVSDVSTVLDGVEPPFQGYRRTEQALERYVELAGKDNGEKLPVPSKAIDPGQRFEGTPRLTALLRLLGDLPDDVSAPADPQLYDGALVEAVKRFQRRHGLDGDGRLGSATIHQLNVPLSDRVRQLQLALERWRWLPTEFTGPPIIVNIPDFRLRAVDKENKIAFEMPVVVGKAMATETPVFSRDMTFVVFRPYWNVPPGIMRRTVLPRLKRDRNYLVNQNFEVTTNDGKIVTAGEVSDEVLAQLQSGKLLVRQKPGPNNALGLIKFMFPNEYHVYLHSTPATELFSRSRRDFSSGCIRVAKPAELAVWVLRNNPGWTLDRVQQAMQNGTDNVTVSLAEPIPVFIVYGTALAHENGEVHFYDDIYGFDAKLAAALANGYPYIKAR